jgi:hypothetical protein
MLHVKFLIFLTYIYSYHDGHQEDWGKYLGAEVLGGRIVAVKLLPRSIDHTGTHLRYTAKVVFKGTGSRDTVELKYFVSWFI